MVHGLKNPPVIVGAAVQGLQGSSSTGTEARYARTTGAGGEAPDPIARDRHVSDSKGVAISVSHALRSGAFSVRSLALYPTL